MDPSHVARAPAPLPPTERNWLSLALFAFMDPVLRKGAGAALEASDCLPLAAADLASPRAGAARARGGGPLR